MKKISYLLLSSILLLLFSCDSDNDTDEEVIIVTTADLNFQIEEGAEAGTVIGDLSGSSNNGSVTYSVISQTPNGAVAVGGDTMGSLIVADASAFDAEVNPEISVTVGVTNGDVTEESAITIQVSEACPLVDFTVFNTTLNIQLGFEGELVDRLGSNFEGQGSECGIFTITGPDPLGSEDENDSIELQFIPSNDDPSVGTVTMDITYGVNNALGNYFGTGTYDTNTGVIRIDYSILFSSDNFLEEDNIIEINISTNDIPDGDEDPDPDGEFVCPTDIDLSAFNATMLSIASGPLDADFEEQEVDLGTNFSGEVVDCELTISGDDIFGLSCADAIGLSVVLQFDESTDFDGVVIPGEFFSSAIIEDYGCDGINEFTVTAIYNQGSGVIDISWFYEDDNQAFIDGSATITAP